MTLTGQAEPTPVLKDTNSYAHSTDLILRGLGLTYLIAFASLAWQLSGLFGSAGVTPIARTLDHYFNQVGLPALAHIPTLFWFSAHDAVLHAVCLGGIVLAGLLLLRFWTFPSLIALWIFYLSFVTPGGPFLSFQWDSFLLEFGFLGILAAVPSLRRSSPPTQAHPLASFLLRWLLFRLMLASGVVKLASGDPTWLDGSALAYHFETQPLPSIWAWFADKLPSFLLTVSCLGMYVIELFLPFFIWLTRPFRLIAAAGFISLQIGILLTGSYGFFNLLTIILCLILIDDQTWKICLPRLSLPISPSARRWPTWGLAPITAFMIFLSIPQLAGAFGWRFTYPSIAGSVQRYAAPWRTVNSYGLFAIMTTERREIVLQGSHNGTDWKTYTFRWNPGPPSRFPAYPAPYQPRLDWQFWFAALSRPEQNPWLYALGERLLIGSPAVSALFREDPFPDGPPTYLRAVIRDYRFSSVSEWRESGDWWIVGPERTYLQPIWINAN
jgi:hypothetical protein